MKYQTKNSGGHRKKFPAKTNNDLSKNNLEGQAFQIECSELPLASFLAQQR